MRRNSDLAWIAFVLIGFVAVVGLASYKSWCQFREQNARKAANAAYSEQWNAGREAFSNGVKPSSGASAAWISGWERAKEDTAYRKSHEIAERRKLRAWQEIVDAGEAAAESTYYKTAQFDYDFDQWQDLAQDVASQDDWETKEFLLNLTKGLEYKMERDKFPFIRAAVAKYGIYTADQWIAACDKAGGPRVFPRK